jgi:hypothetical protein
MQHMPDQHGNLMPKAQTKRLLTAERILQLEKEVSRLEANNRDLRNKRDRFVTKHPQVPSPLARLRRLHTPPMCVQAGW